MPYCAAYGCNQKEEKGVHFHKFPKDEGYKRIWIHRCGQGEKGWQPKERTVLCSRHFEKNQYERDPDIIEKLGGYRKARALLKPHGVPTLFANKQWDDGTIGLNEAEGSCPSGTETATFGPDNECSPHSRTSRRAMSNKKPTRSAYLKRRKAETLREQLKLADENEQQLAAADLNQSLVETPSVSRPFLSSVDSSEPLCSVEAITSQPQKTTCSIKIQTECPKQRTMCIQVTSPSPKCVGIGIQCELLTDQDPRSEQATVPLIPVDEMEPTSAQSDVDNEPEEEDDVDDDSDTESVCCDNFINPNVDVVNEKHFLVSEKSLCELLTICKVCLAPASITTRAALGPMVVVSVSCQSGHDYVWYSQSRLCSMPVGNLICARSILFSGSSPSKVLTVLRHMKVPVFSLNTFSKLQLSGSICCKCVEPSPKGVTDSSSICMDNVDIGW